MLLDTSNSSSLPVLLYNTVGGMGFGWVIILAVELSLVCALRRCGFSVRRFPEVLLVAVAALLAAARRIAGH